MRGSVADKGPHRHRQRFAQLCFRKAFSRRRLFRLFLLAFFFFNCLDILYVRHCLSRTEPLGNPSPSNEHIFIASIHWNNEGILRSAWSEALEKLIQNLGSSNVFVSIYESGSWDGTKAALQELDAAFRVLGVQRNITLSETTHLEEISSALDSPHPEGWIKAPSGDMMLRRIPYLAKLRNLSLKPLQELADQGMKFDKVLFLNDVVFKTEDALRLLNTNGGDYAAACAMDFAKPPRFYDTFALRDSEGHEHLMQTWPYFRSRTSRRALKANQPVPVSSCWNGMVVMPAHLFTGPTPVRFRGIADSLAARHLEGSECCLVHADNPLSSHKSVYVNPTVRVGYSKGAYESICSGETVLSSWRLLMRLWENRIRRWFTTTFFKEWIVYWRMRKWKSEHAHNEEKGTSCLINEMQVLVENGWAHI